MSEYKYILNWPGRDWNGEIYRDGGDRYVQESSAYVLKADVERHGVVVSMVEWDGQGLPPVGTVCEIAPDCKACHWAEGEVLAVGPEWFAARICGETMVLLVDGYRFRPIPTPEQIAAEERRLAVNGMVDFARAFRGVPCDPFRPFFEALYDAGYRKS